MTILCILLAAALISVVGISFWREKLHRLVVADLLDRVMARSYGEYVQSHPATPTRPMRRRVLSDQDMAELETRALAESGRGERK